MIYFKDLGLSAKLPSAFNTGLANQFFQIASTVGHALKYNDEAIFPEWKYNEFLNGIKTDNSSNFKITFNYNEPCFNYLEIPYINGMNLSGYFQSEKYFSHCKKEIKNIFTLKENIKNSLFNKWKDKLNNSVSIHVRRGDYLHKQHFHPCPVIEYFLEGIKIIRKTNNIDNILVFSDDINWCKQNFKNDNYIFVENQLDYEDLFLMSFCEHNIITNSSFSWWASWLNDNENKMIIAPKIWLHPSLKINTSDIYLEKMIII